jgi:hypothetical protein
MYGQRPAGEGLRGDADWRGCVMFSGFNAPVSYSGFSAGRPGAGAVLLRVFIEVFQILNVFHPCHARFRVWLLRVGTQGVWSCSFTKRVWNGSPHALSDVLAGTKVRIKDTSRWRLPVLRPGLGGSSPTRIPYARRPASPSSTHHPVCNPCSREDDGMEYGAGLEQGDRIFAKKCRNRARD